MVSDEKWYLTPKGVRYHFSHFAPLRSSGAKCNYYFQERSDADNNHYFAVYSIGGLPLSLSIITGSSASILSLSSWQVPAFI